MLVIYGCGSTDELASSRVSGSAYANVDLENTRNSPSALDSKSVADLEHAWSQSSAVSGASVGLIGSPVLIDEVAYLQDADSNVRAIDLESGGVLWTKTFDSPAGGPIGVAVGKGRVFGATPTSAFALDARTGEAIWVNELAPDGTQVIIMTPGYHDGLVYVSTSPESGDGGEIGVLWALDARTGKRVWHFNTAQKGLWGNPEVNFGGGISHPPAFDGEGSMYVGTSNPGPTPGTDEHPWGSSRPGPNLFTNSIVKLDEKTGKVEWHYQVIPHGLCNGDVGGPVLTEVGGRKIVVAGGLAGFVVALDQGTGKLLWKRAVGRHNGHDDIGLYAMRGEYGRLKLPMTVYPGTYGGVAGPLAVNGSTVFVPVVDNATTLEGQETAAGSEEFGGQLVALDLRSGAVSWKKDLPSALFGPVSATNDLVFASSFDGGIHAYLAETGGEVWSEQLPTLAEGGMAIADRTLLVRAGFPQEEGKQDLLAYRLGG